MNRLNSYIDRLEEYSLSQHKINPNISSSSVGWHIEHTLKVIIQIVAALEKSNANDYKWRFNVNRFLIWTINHIPRGKGKAPKTVIPEGEITIESLKQSIEKTRLAIIKIKQLHPNSYFKHPYFGDLKLHPTIKFLGLHTNHHLKIINDIIKAS